MALVGNAGVYCACFLITGLSRVNPLSFRAIRVARPGTVLLQWGRPISSYGWRRDGGWTAFGRSGATIAASTSVDDDVSTRPVHSKWEFAAAIGGENGSGGNVIRNILVCGDGDLSYSAEIARELDESGIDLYATVLEEEDVHNQGRCWLMS